MHTFTNINRNSGGGVTHTRGNFKASGYKDKKNLVTARQRFATRFRWPRSVARRRAYITARMVARHSGDVCDQVPMARSRSSNHGAELTYGDEKIVIF